MTTPPRGLAIAALTVGIIAFFIGWLPYVGLIAGLAAVVLGIIALTKRQPKGFAVTGLTLGTLAMLASIVVTIVATILPTQLNDQSATPMPSTAEQPTETAACLTITDGARAKLAGKIAERIPGTEIQRVGLVASTTSDMHVLAVEFTDPGLGTDFTGIWGSLQDLTIDEDPAFVAVDDVAAASAEYLQPADFQGGVGAQLPAAEEAVACLA